MAYNLRPRSVGDAVQEIEHQNDDFGGETSDENDDAVEEMTDKDTDGTSSDEISETEDVQVPEQRRKSPAQQARRGRPPSTMKGKNARFSSVRIHIPSPTNDVLHCEDIFEFWETLFTVEMHKLIVKYTNMKIELTQRAVTDKGSVLQTYHHTTDLIEINAFIGLLYYAGIWRCSHIGVKELWANTEGALGDPYKMKITGTIRKNKREIPLEMKIAEDEKSAKYGYHDNITLLSWTPKKNKIILVASSFTRSSRIDARSGKPQMISHYNNTKGGTDVFDKLSAVNSRILHTCHTMQHDEKIAQRLPGRESQKQIALRLVTPLLQRRLREAPSLRMGIRKSIEKILDIDPVPPSEVERLMFTKRVRCALLSKNRSVAWKYFIDYENKAQCKIYHVEVKTAGNTTNLVKHLKRKHLGLISDQPPAKNMHLEQHQTDAGEKNPDDPDSPSTVTVSECHTQLKSVHQMVVWANEERRTPSKSSQSRIDKTFHNLKSFEGGGSKAAEITNAIIFMIAKDNMPYRMVEEEGFQHFMKTALPLYKVPGRKSITRLIEGKYEVLSIAVKSKLSVSNTITLTSDVWTETLNTRSYLGMTAHFVMEGKLESVTLGVTSLEDRHTGEYLSQWLLQMCNDWKIDIVAVVTDSEANILKAVNIAFGKDKHLSCFAHALNLVASQIIEQESTVHSMCDKVKALVTFFKQSVTAADKLRKYRDKKLIQSVPTRWNSTYFMFERFIEMSEIISAVLLKFPKSPLMLSASELQLARETVQVLKPLEHASKEAGGQTYVTASRVIPLTNFLKSRIEKLEAILTTSGAQKLRECLMIAFEKKFGRIEYMNLLATATILDPRFKKMYFRFPEAYARALMKLKREIQNFSMGSEQCQKEKISLIAEKKVLDLEENSLEAFHENLSRSSQSQVSTETGDLIPTDLKHYLSQPTHPYSEHPLEYWHNNNVYPDLKKAANRYLHIVATSVPSERLFSKAGNIMTERRNRLSPKHLQELLFLSSLSRQNWCQND
ncbi:E3 SUMO-protein ligase ZBED1-like [Venturia canescens]|uniref:E3 SUMO-protein ligase ZBED1-like n=1 Tax=Venturia canescens TaxID=32260 RepID=UPI001C9BF7AF|nr:E3 SUMO-protein ligase ZBED1-like [Venturia canescens]